MAIAAGCTSIVEAWFLPLMASSLPPAGNGELKMIETADSMIELLDISL
jgi:hypothetical protein